MRVRFVACFVIAGAAFTVLDAAWTQQAPAPLTVNAPPAPRAMTDLLTVPSPSVMIPGRFVSVTGQPFVLTEKQTTLRTGADGTRFTSHVEIRRYRDAEGRTRETTSMVQQDGSLHVMRDSIEDPVARLQISLTAATKTATVYHYPETAQVRKPAAPTASVSPEKPAEMKKNAEAQHEALKEKFGDFIREKLPGKQIAGVYAEGERITRTVPAGAQENDREFKVIMETWISPDLKIQLYQSTQDPRIGTMTHEVTDLSRADPDPSIFQVPEGYKVKDIAPKAANPQ